MTHYPLFPGGVDESAVGGDVPDGEAGPFPVGGGESPLEGLLAEGARGVEGKFLAVGADAVAPDDFGELEGEGPAEAGRSR